MATRAILIEPGAVVRKGDLLRIGYWAAGRCFGVIISGDGRGVVTQYIPARGEQALSFHPSARSLVSP